MAGTRGTSAGGQAILHYRGDSNSPLMAGKSHARDRAFEPCDDQAPGQEVPAVDAGCRALRALSLEQDVTPHRSNAVRRRWSAATCARTAARLSIGMPEFVSLSELCGRKEIHRCVGGVSLWAVGRRRRLLWRRLLRWGYGGAYHGGGYHGGWGHAGAYHGGGYHGGAYHGGGGHGGGSHGGGAKTR